MHSFLQGFFLLVTCFVLSTGFAQPIFKLEGHVADVETDARLAGMKVKLVNQDLGTVLSTTTDRNGTYRFEFGANGERLIQWNTDYLIVVDDPDYRTAKGCGYIGAEGAETTKGMDESTAFIHDFALVSFNCGVDERLPMLSFDASCALEQQHKDALAAVVKMMEEFVFVGIEVCALPAKKGNKEDNWTCAVKRAQACVAYLAEQGVDPKRIELVTETAKSRKHKKDSLRVVGQSNQVVFRVTSADYTAKQKE